MTDYPSLQATIARWLKRADLADQIPDFIRLAEVKMGEDLKARNMSATAVLTITPGNAYVNLPLDFKLARTLSVNAWPVQYAAPTDFAYDDAQGQPTRYTVIGGQVKLHPVPDDAYAAEMVYEQLIPALTDDSPNNWLLARSPNAYLFGALMMAQPFIFNDERVATFQQMYNDAITGINISDWHTGDAMTVRSDAKVA